MAVAAADSSPQSLSRPPPPMGMPSTPTGAGFGPGSNGPTNVVSTECSCCGDLISDRFILQVANRSWHANCLRCTVCHTLLDGHASCFLRDELLYCKIDYTKYVATRIIEIPANRSFSFDFADYLAPNATNVVE